MKLLDYTTEHGFLPHLKCSSLEEAVVSLVGTLAEAEAGAPAEALVREVMRREKEGSTAVGGGLVIPHARFAQAKSVRIAVATLDDPLPSQADDGRPIDIVILLIGPAGDPRQLLRVLARLARLVRQGSFLDGLRGAETGAMLRLAFAMAEESST